MPSPEQLYTLYKPLLFAIAYRMLGTVADAEDIVQETFLDWSQREPSEIGNEKAFLCRVATNKCIDRLRSASRQREVYTGPWLPEPLLTGSRLNDAGENRTPAEEYLHKESLSTAYLLLLQQLSWTERAVFVLREVLQYEYDEIAEIVEKSSANCRQIYHRAKRSIRGSEEGPGVLAAEAAAAAAPAAGVVEPFVQALIAGNTAQLLQLLKADAVLYSDGGGKVTAAVRPILGAERILSFFRGTAAKLPADTTIRFEQVNGTTGLILYEGDRPTLVMTCQVQDGRISEFYLQVNPDKLIHVKPPEPV